MEAVTKCWRKFNNEYPHDLHAYDDLTEEGRQKGHAVRLGENTGTLAAVEKAEGKGRLGRHSRI